MSENGFVKLPREIVKREWFGEGATLTVYVFLLCAAAFRDMGYAGRTLRKGQYITSVKKLSEACRQSVQQTRTALNHLQATNDITVVTTSKFSIITVNFMTEANDLNTAVNTLANTLVNKQINNISRSQEKEDKKEECIREEAAPPFAPNTDNDNSVEALIDRYGSAAVKRYEEKFREWAKGKNVARISMYPTIAKWLAQDVGEVVKRESSIDIDEFERKLLEQYMK